MAVSGLSACSRPLRQRCRPPGAPPPWRQLVVDLHLKARPASCLKSSTAPFAPSCDSIRFAGNDFTFPVLRAFGFICQRFSRRSFNYSAPTSPPSPVVPCWFPRRPSSLLVQAPTCAVCHTQTTPSLPPCAHSRSHRLLADAASCLPSHSLLSNDFAPFVAIVHFQNASIVHSIGAPQAVVAHCAVTAPRWMLSETLTASTDEQQHGGTAL